MKYNKWYYDNYDTVKCPNYGFCYNDEVSFLVSKIKDCNIIEEGFPFCPSCGIKMEGILEKNEDN